MDNLTDVQKVQVRDNLSIYCFLPHSKPSSQR